MRMLFFIFAFLILFNPVCIDAKEAKTPPQKTDAKIYKYPGKNGVDVFTNNIDSIPLSLRNKVEVLEVKPKSQQGKRSVLPEEPAQPFWVTQLQNPFIRNVLIAIVAIVLLWVLKLWIKNMILAFVAKIAIKVAIVGILYMLAHQWFFSPEKFSFFETVKKTIAPYREVLPIQKATEGIKEFNKKEAQKKKTLDTIP